MDTSSPSEATPPAQSTPIPKRRRRWLRRLGWAALWIVTLYALFVVVENWRGRRAWNAYVAQMKAIGEPLDAAAVLPSPVPDEENFAMAPLFQPLFDYARDPKTGEVRWRNPQAKEALDHLSPHGPVSKERPRGGTWLNGKYTDLEAWQSYYRTLPELPKNGEPGDPARDVLVALSKYDDLMTQLREAAPRPESRFPVRYEDHIYALMPHISVLRQLARLTQLRASAELSLGEVDLAFKNLQLTYRLAESVEHEPTLIAQLVRTGIMSIAMQPVWEGTTRHQWKEDQLRELQRILAGINIGASYRNALRGERHFAFGILDSLRKQPGELSRLAQMGTSTRTPSAALTWLAPQGWIDQNKASMGRFFQGAISSVETDPVRFHRARSEQVVRDLESPEGPLGYVYTVFARVAGYGWGVQPMARHQGLMDLGLIAVMLERHHLRHQQYPKSLAQLDEDIRTTPRGVPLDCVTGNPPHYSLQPDGTYTLYYQGWNGTDDGGQVGREKEGSDFIDLSKGDWVWPQPVAP